MYEILYEIFYRPFLNALIFIYEHLAFHDLGIAIILLTIIVRIILFPLFHAGAKNQTKMQKLQPKIKELQKKHENDKQEQTKALMALYKENDTNPFSGFLLLFLQLPILIGLYRVFFQSFGPDTMKALYSFVADPGPVNMTFLGLINLAKPSIILVVLAAIFQYVQTRMILPPKVVGQEEDAMARMSRQMVFVGPAITIAIFWGRPAAIALYWAVSSLFSVIQQVIVNKKLAEPKS